MDDLKEPARTLKIYFVTWNVATRHPEQDVHQLLGITHEKSTVWPDLYVIGLQEVKAQPQNMMLDLFMEDPWTKWFRDVLRKYDYVKIRTQRLQGLVLNVFCLRRHVTRLRMIEARYTRTGLGGMWGNKGAVSVRFNIYGVSVCLVNTHLTPHDHLLADRVSDYNTILREHTFDAPDTSNILFHDYVFWIGDLNFRLNGDDLPAPAIDLLVKQQQLNLLLRRDQLRAVMENGEAFAELKEESIDFPPTYKFEFASQSYDLKRRPSWTDRILYKVNANVYENVVLQAVQKSYKSHSSYVQSDHKPVTGEFEAVVRPDVEDHGVEFQPLTAWFIDEQNSVSYKLLGEASIGVSDWVGLFPDGFSSLDDYIVYEYVSRGKNSPVGAEPHAFTDRIFFSDTALRSPGMYRLVYISQRGDFTDILGMSPPFPGHRRVS